MPLFFAGLEEQAVAWEDDLDGVVAALGAADALEDKQAFSFVARLRVQA